MLLKASSSALFLLIWGLHPPALGPLSARSCIISSSSYPCISCTPPSGSGCGPMPTGRGCPEIVGAYCPCIPVPNPAWDPWFTAYQHTKNQLRKLSCPGTSGTIYNNKSHKEMKCPLKLDSHGDHELKKIDILTTSISFCTGWPLLAARAAASSSAYLINITSISTLK